MTSGSPDTNLSVGKGLREREGGKEGVRAAQGLIRHRENWRRRIPFRFPFKVSGQLLYLGQSGNLIQSENQTIQRGVNLFELFAKHQPGVADCGWLQPGRNFLST